MKTDENKNAIISILTKKEKASIKKAEEGFHSGTPSCF
jgi:hypothetical protein